MGKVDAVAEVMEQLAQRVKDESWLRENASLAHEMKLVLNNSGAFRCLNSPPPETVPVQLEVEWLGPGMALSDLESQYYALYAEIGEQSTFLHWAVESDCISLSLVAGHILGWQAHGHFISIKFVGSRIQELLRAIGPAACLRDAPVR